MAGGTIECKYCHKEQEHISGLLYRFGMCSECADVWFESMSNFLKSVRKTKRKVGMEKWI